MRPLVSVIVPVFGIEDELPRGLESLAAQTLDDMEFILVDDGSPDRCGEICDAFAERDPRFLVVHQENGGLSAARNTGLDVASGEFIGFMDGDDFVEPNMFDLLSSNAQASDADVSVCTKFIEREGVTEVYYSKPERLVWTGREALRELLSYSRFDFGVHDKLWRSDVLNGIRFEPGRVYEDYYPMTLAMSRVERAVYESAPLYHYVKRAGSITGSKLTESKCRDRMHAARMVREVVAESQADLAPLAENLETIILLRLAFEIAGWEDAKSDEWADAVRAELFQGWRHRIANSDTSWSRRAALLLYSVSPRLYHRARRQAERQKAMGY